MASSTPVMARALVRIQPPNHAPQRRASCGGGVNGVVHMRMRGPPSSFVPSPPFDHATAASRASRGVRLAAARGDGTTNGSSNGQPIAPADNDLWEGQPFPVPSYLQSMDETDFCQEWAHERNARLLSSVEYDPVWETICEEAVQAAQDEPMLSSYLYASILSHRSFERSLAFILANRLQDPTLLATQIMKIFLDVLDTDPELSCAARADLVAVRERDPACDTFSGALLYFKGFHAVQIHRIAHALWNKGQRLMAKALQSRMSEVLSVDIHPAARLGKGLLMDHGMGVVIGETAVVGDNVSILQGVTLGGTGKENGDRHPKVADGVLIGANATILKIAYNRFIMKWRQRISTAVQRAIAYRIVVLMRGSHPSGGFQDHDYEGNIAVGKGAMVAAGSLVLKEVAPFQRVAGAPAKPVGTVDAVSGAGLTMKQSWGMKVGKKGGSDSGAAAGGGEKAAGGGKSSWFDDNSMDSIPCGVSYQGHSDEDDSTPSQGDQMNEGDQMYTI